MKTINSPFFPSIRVSQTVVASLLMAACGIGCGSSGSASSGTPRLEGQSEFSSSPPGQPNNGRGEGFGSAGTTGGTGTGGGLAAPGATNAADNGGGAQSAAPRTVEETDLYRV